MANGKPARGVGLAGIIWKVAGSSSCALIKTAIKAECVDTPLRLFLYLSLTFLLGQLWGQIASTLLADTVFNYITQKDS